MKQSEKLTKLEERIQKMILEATDAVLMGVENMIRPLATKEELLNLEKKLEVKIENLEHKVDSNYSAHKNQIDGLKAELSKTVSKEELYKKFN